MSTLNRTIRALLLGPALGGLSASALAVAVGFVVSVVERTVESNALGLSFAIFLYLAAASSVAALVVAMTLGLGWHSVATSLRWTSLHAYWFPGATVGLLLSVIGLLPFGGRHSMQDPISVHQSRRGFVLSVQHLAALSGSSHGSSAAQIATLLLRHPGKRDPGSRG